MELNLSVTLIYLFSIDDQHFYLAKELRTPERKGYRLDSIRNFRTAAPQWLSFAGITAHQLWHWYDSHVFCGHCGCPMVHSEKERMLQCPECGQTEYPKISPAVIVAVTDGDRLLMSRYRVSHNPYRSYALIAGFVEIGETFEDTVRREVMEEVGLKVKNIRY